MIEVKHLTKRYGNIEAVSDLNFKVEPGKIYGFLGPNGAGKSTTMNIITGCLSATEGSVTIDGHDIYEEPAAAKKLIGYLPEMPPLYLDMTPAEYLKFVGQAKGVKKKELSAQIEDAMAKTGIEGVSGRLIRNLSKGYRQRVGIAQALLGNPQVVILDEPTVGLDPKQMIEIRQLIRKLGEDHTVILSSHILTEVNQVCDHIIIISHGRLVADDEKENLVAGMSGSHTLTYTVRGKYSQVVHALEHLPGDKRFEPSAEDNGVDVTITLDDRGFGAVSDETNPHDIRDEIFRVLARTGCPILAMGQKKASLEEVFLQLTDQMEIEIEEEMEQKERDRRRKKQGRRKAAKDDIDAYDDFESVDDAADGAAESVDGDNPDGAEGDDAYDTAADGDSRDTDVSGTGTYGGASGSEDIFADGKESAFGDYGGEESDGTAAGASDTDNSRKGGRR
ncbi:MAG: ABC transporter ATP-binding protein [Lachnospiraceae bacterium]|nr:ABC transporter ATP-binding protein [Lachnospiraceae bacterium]